MQMFQTVILAGGLATRLRPVTETIPKSLIEVAGKPFIDYQLDYLFKQGIQKVCLCVGYLGEMVEEYVQDGAKWGLEVVYSYDGEKLLGTGGAIKQALPKLEDEFFILYGDSYLPIDFAEVQKSYHKQKKLALMTILDNSDKWDNSNVIFINNNIVEYNKKEKKKEMNYIDYGLSIINKKLFINYTDHDTFDLAEIFHELSIAKKLASFEVNQRFYEVGSFVGLKDFEEYILEQTH